MICLMVCAIRLFVHTLCGSLCLKQPADCKMHRLLRTSTRFNQGCIHLKNKQNWFIVYRSRAAIDPTKGSGHVSMLGHNCTRQTRRHNTICCDPIAATQEISQEELEEGVAWQGWIVLLCLFACCFEVAVEEASLCDKFMLASSLCVLPMIFQPGRKQACTIPDRQGSLFQLLLQGARKMPGRCRNC